MVICLLLEQGMSRKCHGITWSLVALERCHVHGHAHLVLGEGSCAGSWEGGAGAGDTRDTRDTREGLRQRGIGAGAAGTQHQPRSHRRLRASSAKHIYPQQQSAAPQRAGSSQNIQI